MSMVISERKKAEFERMVQAINGNRMNKKGDDIDTDLKPAIVKISDSKDFDSLSKNELLKEAHKYAKETIDEYEMPISIKDFTINVSERMTRSRGICRRKSGNIQLRLSWPGYENHGWEETKQTIRHELIHVHQYVNHDEADHGPTFKEWSGKLDVTVYADSASSEGKYTVECPECDQEWNRQQDCKLVRTADNRKCSGCGHVGLAVETND